MEQQAVISTPGIALADAAHSTAVQKPPAARTIPLAFIVTATVLIGLLNAFIGVQILPALDAGSAGTAMGIVLLALPTLLIPAGLAARLLNRPTPESVATSLAWIGLIAA